MAFPWLFSPSGSSASFTVTVKGAREQIIDLITLVQSFGLRASVERKLVSNLEDALAAIGLGDTAGVCAELDDFSQLVMGLSGSKIPVDQANQLIAAANQIKAALGCM